MSPNDADGMANSVDPDQKSLIWVCTVCSDLSVPKLRTIMVKCPLTPQVRNSYYKTLVYRKIPKYSYSQKIAVIIQKF